MSYLCLLKKRSHLWSQYWYWRATALQLAEQGAHCILLARRAERLESLKAEIVSKGAAEVLVGDLDQRDATVFCGTKYQRFYPHIDKQCWRTQRWSILNAAEEEFTVAFGNHVLAAHRSRKLC